MLLIISFLFISLAAICNAIMDTITHHWDISIFDEAEGEITKRDMWWNPDYSWINKYLDKNPEKGLKKIFFGLFDKPFTDAWHTFKSLMIIFIVLSIITFNYSLAIWYEYIIAFIIYGILWNLIFNLFYNKLLKK